MDMVTQEHLDSFPAGKFNEPSPVMQLIYTSKLVSVGLFRCRPWHDLFHEDGRARAHMMVFPRSSVYIQHEDYPLVVASPNTVMFYNRDQEYQRRKLSERGDICEFFVFDEEVIRQATKHSHPHWTERNRPFPCQYGPAKSPVYLRQRQVVDHILSSSPPDEVYIQETMFAVLEKSLAGAGRQQGKQPGTRHPKTRRAHAQLAREAQSILAAGYSEPPSIEKLAEMLFTSPYHLCRVFRRETGQTIHKYLTRFRLHTALEWVSRGKEDLSQVAFHLGYSSHSHFAQAFKQTFGLSPSQLRSH